MLAINSGRAPQFRSRELLNPQSKRPQPVAEFPLQFTNVKEIRYRELEWQQEHLIEKVRPFEVDEDRSIGYQDSHRSGCHLIQSPVEFTHGNAEQLGGSRFSDYAFGQSAIA